MLPRPPSGRCLSGANFRKTQGPNPSQYFMKLRLSVPFLRNPRISPQKICWQGKLFPSNLLRIPRIRDLAWPGTKRRVFMDSFSTRLNCTTGKQLEEHGRAGVGVQKRVGRGKGSIFCIFAPETNESDHKTIPNTYALISTSRHSSQGNKGTNGA